MVENEGWREVLIHEGGGVMEGKVMEEGSEGVSDVE